MAAQKTIKTSKAKSTLASKKAKPTRKVVKRVAPIVSKMDTDLPKSKGRFSKKTLIIFALVFLAAVIYLGQRLIVVATVNGSPIYRWTVVNRLEKLGGQQVVDELVQEKLIKSEAARLGVKADEALVNAEIENVRKNSEAQGMPLETALEQANMTMEDYVDSVRLQYTVRAILEKEIAVTDDEVNATYDEYKDSESFAEMSEEEAKNQIREGLKDQKLQEKATDWLDGLKSSASIKTYVEY